MLYRHYNFELPEHEPQTKSLPEFEPLYITHARYNESWKSILHSHPYTEIFYVLNGRGQFHIEGAVYPVKNNDLIIINPNRLHTEYSDTAAGHLLEYVVIGINGVSFQSKSEKPSGVPLYNLSECRGEASFLLKTILQEFRRKKDNYLFVCRSLLHTLLLLIIRNTKSMFVSSLGIKANRECLFIEQYIDEHFSEDITLDFLSSLTYMDKYYMVHLFKKHTGDSPIRFLIKRRIAEAKYLLKTTNYSAAKIAQLIGFSSQSYFSQAFFREVGMSPIQYRKNGADSASLPDKNSSK